MKPDQEEQGKKSKPESELTEKDLEGVAGGALNSYLTNPGGPAGAVDAFMPNPGGIAGAVDAFMPKPKLPR